MNEFYTEHMIKQQPTAKTFLMKVGIILATIMISFLAFLFLSMFAPVIITVLIFVDVYLFRGLDLEFEYTYVDGEMDIDKIMSQQRRKRVMSINIKEVELVAPVTAGELHAYEQLKTINCSSNEEHAKVYVIVTVHKGEKVKVLFEPNNIILEGMRMRAPRKVIL